MTGWPDWQGRGGLRAAHGVAAWAKVSMVTADLDGQAVPMLLGDPSAAVAPPILSGHPVYGKNQVVLGPATLAALHQQVGQPGGRAPRPVSGPHPGHPGPAHGVKRLGIPELINALPGDAEHGSAVVIGEADNGP